MSKELAIALIDPVSLEDDTTKTVESDSKSDSKVDSEPDSKPESSLAVATSSKSTPPPTTAATGKTEEEEDAPVPPARPLSPAAQIKKDLKDAFPQIDDKYIEAVLIASEGRADPAFNALLFLLDPTFKPEPVPVTRTAPKAHREVTDDELLARQLQKEFEKEDRRRRAKAHKSRQAERDQEDDSPDEFDQIKETFTQGFEEAKTTINSWVSGLSKKFGQDDEAPQRGKQSPKLFGALGGSSFNTNTRKTKNFDDDPEILALDFRKSVDLDEKPPQLPKREGAKKPQEKWQPLNLDVPVTSDAFLVTDSEDEDKK